MDRLTGGEEKSGVGGIGDGVCVISGAGVAVMVARFKLTCVSVG